MTENRKTLLLSEDSLVFWPNKSEKYIARLCRVDASDEDLLPADEPVKAVLAGPGLRLNNTGVSPKELLIGLAGKGPDGKDIAYTNCMSKLIAAASGSAVAMPVYGYSHGNLSVSLERAGQYADPWDAGFCGIVAMRKTDAIQNGASPENWKAWAENALRDFVSRLDDYLTDGAYELWIIKDEGKGYLDDAVVLDNFGPFMGSDLLRNGAAEALDAMGYGFSAAMREGRLKRGRIKKTVSYGYDIEDEDHG